MHSIEDEHRLVLDLQGEDPLDPGASRLQQGLRPAARRRRGRRPRVGFENYIECVLSLWG